MQKRAAVLIAIALFGFALVPHAATAVTVPIEETTSTPTASGLQTVIADLVNGARTIISSIESGVGGIVADITNTLTGPGPSAPSASYTASAASPQETAPRVPPTAVVPSPQPTATTTVVTQTIIQRETPVVEIVPSAHTVTKADLAGFLASFKNLLVLLPSSSNASGNADSTSVQQQLDALQREISQTNRINSLSGVTISNSTITNTVGAGGTSGATALSGLSDVSLSSPGFGHLLEYNGSRWTNVSTSSLGILAGSTQWTTAGSNIYFNTGNIGIGTTTPPVPLAIDSTSTTGTILRISNSSTGGHIFDLLSTGSGNTGGAGRLDIFDLTSGLPRLSIAANGNVGVGTTSPFANFAVNGSGYFSGALNLGSALSLTNGGTGGTSTSTARVALGVDFASSSVATYASYNIVGWGDSLTAGNEDGSGVTYLNALSTDLGGRPTFNQGVGGQTSIQIAARMLASPTMNNYTAIIWTGRNNYASSTQVEADVASMIAALGSNTHYLILSILNGNYPPGENSGGANYNQIITLNNYFAATYAGHYLDVRSYLIQHGLSDAGITPSGQDLTDISNDIPPTDLRVDNLHLNAAGYRIVATQVANFIRANLDTLNTQTSVLTPSNLPSIFANPFTIGSNTQASGFFSSLAIATTSTSSPNYALDVYGVINTNSLVGGYYQDGHALLSASSTLNTFVVGGSVNSTVTGINNNAFGTSLIVTSGSNNNVFGKQALNSDTSGSDSLAIGSYALRFQTTGNQNIGLGSSVLTANTTGSGNTVMGYLALSSATTTSDETAVGWAALKNEISSGSTPQNTAFGYQALTSNTYGLDNTAIGFDALQNNTVGNNNTAVGAGSLGANTSGLNSVAIGNSNTLANNTTGSYNIGIGVSALKNNSTGQFNVAIGAGDNSLNGPLNNNTTGQYNIALGQRSLNNNTTGSFDIALGGFALGVNTSATNTVAIGYRAAFGGTGNGAAYTNQGGTVVGYQAGQLFQTGSDFNSLFGFESGNGITTGARNVLFGQSTIAASQNQVTSGSNNIAIGNDVAIPSATSNNQLDIGNFIYGTGLSGTGASVSPAYLGFGTTSPYSRLEVWGSDTASTSAFAVVNSASTTEFAVLDNGNATLSGNLIQSSDQRLKTNVAGLDASSSLAAINALNPVTFNWIDPAKSSVPQYGFIAQDVQRIFPNLVSITAPTALTPDGTLSLNYIDLISPIVRAIQALSQGLTSLENAVVGFADSFTTKQLIFDRATGQQLCLTDANGTSCYSRGELDAAVAAATGHAASASQSSSTGNVPDAPPVIQINGDNPATIQVGANYADLGATITGPQADLNLGIRTFLNGALVSSIVLDTTAAATDTIDYVVSDSQGLTSTSTRTVIVEPIATSTPPPTSASASSTAATSTVQ